MSKQENFIIFSDIKALFFRMKWIILLGACIFGGIGVYKRSQRPIFHKVSGVFRETGAPQMHFGTGNFSSFLASLGMGSKPGEGHALLLSSKILGPVIEKLGMQAQVSTETSIERKKRLMKEALNAERGRPFSPPSQFVFSHVRYLGEKPQGYCLFFTSKESFEVRDNEKNVLAHGDVGEPVDIEGASFTIEKTPVNLAPRTCYSISFTPLSESILSLRKAIEVTYYLGMPSLFSLEIMHTDRHFAMHILNEVMDAYKIYLESESSRVTDGQLAYLVNRRDEYMEKMDEHLRVHVDYLKENLESKGALNLGQQLPQFQGRKQELANDLMGIELKLSELQHVDPRLAVDLGNEVASLQGELHGMSKERDALMLALVGSESYEDRIAKKVRRLDGIEKEELRVKTGIDTFFSSLSEIRRQQDRTRLEANEFGKILSPDATQLKKVQQEKQKLIQFAHDPSGGRLSQEYVKNQIRLLSLQEGTLKQRLFHGTSRGEEYKGIDLSAARQLHLTYLQQRDQAESKIREMAFAKEQLEKDDAEWISIAMIFPDPLCQELVREMGELKKNLRKERLLTEKERERMEKKVSRMKEDLFRHMEQIVALSHLEKERNEDRIASVRLAILDLLGQEASLIEKQIEDRIEEKLAHLKREKGLIEGQIEGIQEEMKGVPDTWLREHRLKFAADMNKGMLEALVHLVESKSIEKNLSILESGPLEFAQGPISPKPPLLKVFGIIGALLGALVTFAGCFIYYIYKGFPLTLRNMSVRGEKVVAPIRPNDLEGLRRLSLVFKEEKKLPLVACLVMGKGYDYTFPFAELLSKEGKKILVIDLNFQKKVQDRNIPGLIHYLEGESKAPSIREKSYGDYIPMGGNTIYGDEILQNPKFNAFLSEKKKEYDVILLDLPASIEETLPKTFFGITDVMVLRLDNASFSVIEPYLEWESSGHSLAFV